MIWGWGCVGRKLWSKWAHCEDLFFKLLHLDDIQIIRVSVIGKLRMRDHHCLVIASSLAHAHGHGRSPAIINIMMLISATCACWCVVRQVRESHSTVRDGRTGQQTVTISRGLGDKVRSSGVCLVLLAVTTLLSPSHCC